MSKHTPGPWRIGALESYDGYTGQPFRNVWAGYGDLATVVARAIRSQGPMTNDVNADARLISAAPELLEAIELLTSMCEVHGDFSNGVTDPTGSIDEGDVIAGEIIKKARAAITKATGG